jgi:hypothetical protein
LLSGKPVNDAGAKISEHARGNALDLGPIRLSNDAVMDLTKKSTRNQFASAFGTLAPVMAARKKGLRPS